jgi:hypothetical protein
MVDGAVFISNGSPVDCGHILLAVRFARSSSHPILHGYDEADDGFLRHYDHCRMAHVATLDSVDSVGDSHRRYRAHGVLDISPQRRDESRHQRSHILATDASDLDGLEQNSRGPLDRPVGGYDGLFRHSGESPRRPAMKKQDGLYRVVEVIAWLTVIAGVFHALVATVWLLEFGSLSLGAIAAPLVQHSRIAAVIFLLWEYVAAGIGYYGLLIETILIGIDGPLEILCLTGVNGVLMLVLGRLMLRVLHRADRGRSIVMFWAGLQRIAVFCATAVCVLVGISWRTALIGAMFNLAVGLLVLWFWHRSRATDSYGTIS